MISKLLMCILGAVVVLFLAQPAQPLDYYTYSQQWAKGACMDPTKKCNPRIPTTFTIHGMWPSNHVKPHPAYCSKSFNSKLINPLMRQLSNVWPNIEIGKTNVRFWENQWNKHGSCSPYTQYDYFNRAIALYNQNNLISMLAARNIRPSGTSRPTQEIIDAIQFHVRVRPLLVCVNGKYLSEIHLCFQAPAFNRIDCPIVPRTCPKFVIF